jgi:hypothetical protein
MFSNPLKKSEPAASAKDQTKANTIPAVEAKTEPKKVDLNKPLVKDAIAKGKSLIKEGKSKADAAMEIFTMLKAEDKDTVIAAFVQGATLTEKGAVTYWYNCKRKSKKTLSKA